MKNYIYDEKNYEKNVALPYIKLNNMLKTIVYEKWEVSFEQIKGVLNSLLFAMNTKGIPQQEQ